MGQTKDAGTFTVHRAWEHTVPMLSSTRVSRCIWMAPDWSPTHSIFLLNENSTLSTRKWIEQFSPTCGVRRWLASCSHLTDGRWYQKAYLASPKGNNDGGVGTGIRNQSSQPSSVQKWHHDYKVVTSFGSQFHFHHLKMYMSIFLWK